MGAKTLRAAAACAWFAAAMTVPAMAEWQTFHGTLVEDRYRDGDSFQIKVDNGYTYAFRLYGADCPETDQRVQERVDEQAKHFKVGTKTLLRWGEKARDFTTDKLKRGGFEVHTKKQDAQGASQKRRFFAIVIVGGESLADALVREGLARAHGASAKYPPDGPGDEWSMLNRLQALEEEARRNRRGIWGDKAK